MSQLPCPIGRVVCAMTQRLGPGGASGVPPSLEKLSNAGRPVAPTLVGRLLDDLGEDWRTAEVLGSFGESGAEVPDEPAKG